MSEIERRLATVQESISDAKDRAGRKGEVRLIAVSKTVPPESIMEAFAAGQRAFGENRVQEAMAKQTVVGQEGERIAWHMIGHVQTNKARQVAGSFSLVHSIDSLRLAEALNRHAGDLGLRLPVLFEINVAGETSKSGFEPSAFCLEEDALFSLDHLSPEGFMTVAPIAQDPEELLPIFRRLREMRDEVRERRMLREFCELSMGMSADFREAIREGATMVRLGRAIFGERPAPGRENHG
jgi:PLP dependent protein